MNWSVSNIKQASENVFFVKCKVSNNNTFLTIEPSIEILNLETLSEAGVLDLVFSSIGQDKKSEFENILASKTSTSQTSDVQVPW